MSEVVLVRGFPILKLEGLNIPGRPYRLVLGSLWSLGGVEEVLAGGQEAQSVLILDKAGFGQFGIPFDDLGILERTLTCTFRSQPLPPLVDGQRRVGGNVLGIRLLRSTWERTYQQLVKVPYASTSQAYDLRLASYGRGPRGYFSPLTDPPFLRFNLQLTEDEYEACLALPADTVFTVGFKLGE